MIYHFHEGALELPQPFSDRTLHLLQLEGDECVLTITREVPAEGVTLEEFVDDAIATVSRRMRRFELGERERSTAAGLPAILWTCRWMHPEKKLMFQKHLQLLNDGVILTVSAAGLVGSASAVGNAVAAAAKTLKLRRKPAGSP